MIPTAVESVEKLDQWIEHNGWAGWDPYDIKGSPPVIRLAAKGNQSRFRALLREIVYEFFYMFPLASRKLLGIERRINPKAMGLFATAYLDLYRYTEMKSYLDKARDCLQYLDENPSTGITGLGWGYPFDWQSREKIPAWTPNGIVTTAAGEAFWQFYRFSGDPVYLEKCMEICRFLVSLPVDSAGKGKICFSYTPLFINHVHNLNLFVAEFLIKTGMETGNEKWTEMGHQAVSYTLSDQRDDGSFDYNGPPEKPQNFVDHYHTGFVLRMLHSVWKLTAREDVFNALDRCMGHYINHFFRDGKIPKLMPGRTYRIDIHSCAESILTISRLSGTFPRYRNMAGNVLEWTIKHLQDRKGYFYYGIQKSRFTGIPYTSKIPYIRWSQAWMLLAMAGYLRASESPT